MDVDVGGTSLTYRVEDDDPLTTLREHAREADLRLRRLLERAERTADSGST